MRYRPADPSLFVDNRKRLAKKLKPGSLAIVGANDILPSNADATLPFVQNSDLYYLTGIDQEESVLLFFPEASDEKLREVLFVRETSEHIAVWEGQKLTKERASELSGIKNVRWLQDFDNIFRDLMIEARRVYLNSNEHRRAHIAVETREIRFIKRCQSEFPLHRYERLAQLMHELRPIKSDAEIELLKEACRITELGFRRVLAFVKPGVKEYEVEAEYIHEFLRHGASGFAYTPIIGSGKNNCALHYLDNDQVCKGGDLLLMDVAARYANYNADMTRTIPVNGKFTDRQKAVYEAVLRTVRHADSILRPGVLLKDYEKEVGKFVEGELVGLGLLEEAKIADQDPDKPLYKKYFMHGTSHQLGIDVHDVGAAWRKVEQGMVFTIEPGIYIPDENFGVRLENDYLIGPSGNTDLMASIPIEVKDIEDGMNF